MMILENFYLVVFKSCNYDDAGKISNYNIFESQKKTSKNYYFKLKLNEGSVKQLH